MKEKPKKFLALGVVLILSLGILCACNKYNAELHYAVDEYLNRDFLKNEIYGFDIDQCGPYETYSPNEAKTFIIKDRQRLDEVFDSFPFNIDFDKQMVVMEVRETILPTRQRKLKSVKIDNDCVRIRLVEPKYTGKMDVASPQQKTTIVILDKVNVTSAIFENSF